MINLGEKSGEQIFAVVPESEGAQPGQAPWWTAWKLAMIHLFWIFGITAIALIVFWSFQDLGRQVGREIMRSAGFAIGYLRLIYMYSACVGTVFLLLRLRRFLPPTHIAVSGDGFKLYRARGVPGAGQILQMRWSDLESIHLEHKSTPRPVDTIVFVLRSGGKKHVEIARAREQKIWAAFFSAVDDYAGGNIDLDNSLYRLLSRVSDPKFTQPWLSALSPPTEFWNYSPLPVKTMLKKGTYAVREQLWRRSQDTTYTVMKFLRGDASVEASEVDAGRRITGLLKEHVLPIILLPGDRSRHLDLLTARAQQLQNLEHGKIARVQEFFVENNRAYLVLEQVRGKSLRELVAERGALPEGEVLSLARQMCEILDYMHGQSPPVVHGAITPDIMIVDSEGALKLSDHRLSTERDRGSISTFEWNLAYMFPGELGGPSTAVGDIHALGAVLYFLLHGEDPQPFAGFHPNGGAGAPGANLDKILQKCGSKNPAERFASVKEINSLLK